MIANISPNAKTALDVAGLMALFIGLLAPLAFIQSLQSLMWYAIFLLIGASVAPCGLVGNVIWRIVSLVVAARICGIIAQ